ncbi:MAG: 6-carboxytetrahydropterin synthase [Gemmatimonadetes bacterium]|nr:6-carboxytetrahydropterin synthase [Gemmatimonadota bacterium]
MPVVRATRRVHFSAAHRLFRSDWSDERNAEVFGDCSNPSWHGHNYELEVTVEGRVDAETGFVMDLKRLKDVLEARVLSDVDHRNLNSEVEWLSGVNPTAENLAVAVWHRIVHAVPEGVRLAKVVIHETPRNSAEYFGPEEDAGP